MAIFFIVGFSLFVGFGLILLTALTSKKEIKKIVVESGLTLDQFQKVCLALAEEMKLSLESYEATESGIDIRAKNNTPFTGGDFLVHGFYDPVGRSVPQPQVIEFSDMIVQERISKGIFITNSRFESDPRLISELAPMEFIDGGRLKELIQKYQIPVIP